MLHIISYDKFTWVGIMFSELSPTCLPLVSHLYPAFSCLQRNLGGRISFFSIQLVTTLFSCRCFCLYAVLGTEESHLSTPCLPLVPGSTLIYNVHLTCLFPLIKAVLHVYPKARLSYAVQQPPEKARKGKINIQNSDALLFYLFWVVPSRKLRSRWKRHEKPSCVDHFSIGKPMDFPHLCRLPQGTTRWCAIPCSYVYRLS